MTSDNGATRCVVGTTNGIDLDPYGTFLDGALANTVIIGARSSNVPLHFVTSNRIKTTMDDSGHFGVGQGFNRNNLPTAIIHISGSSANVANNSPLLNVAHDDNNNILFVTGSGRVGVGTAAPQESLSISGSVALSGAFGNRSIETLTANGAISATTGLTIIDASSSLAVNNSLTMTIANGTFIGQEKKIRGMIISGSTGGATSTAINIGGANIDSPPALPAGQITLSASIPGAGPLFSRAGCTLVWGGTKWLPVGNFNFNINNTGRLF